VTQPVAVLESPQALYEQLRAARQPFLDRAREAANLTTPSILPPEGHTKESKLITPYQAEGAEGVVNLSSKLLLSLFPAGSSFFRFTAQPSKLSAEQKAALDDEEIARAFQEMASAAERMVMEEFEAKALRPRLNIGLRALVVTGNVCLHFDDSDKLRLYHLNEYVVDRDGAGNLLSGCTHEKIAFNALEEGLRMSVAFANPGQQYDGTEEISVYTAFSRVGPDKFQAVQTVGGVESWSATYTEKELPWLPLTFVRVDGEDYGRGRVEEVLGALRSLEALEASGLRGAALAAKHVMLNGSGSGVTNRQLETAQDGAVLSAADGDRISYLKYDKTQDLSVIFDRVTKLESKIQRAFLDVGSAVQRQAERVTAEEVRIVALELEQKLGGVYSSLTQELQLPLVRFLMRAVERGEDGFDFGEEIQPTIITGLDALGRGHDFQRLSAFVQAVGSALGEGGLAAIDGPAIVRQFAVALSLDPDKVSKTDEQLAAERQQAQQQTLLEQGTGPAVTALGNAAQGQAA